MGWHLPTDKNLILHGYSMWLTTWGFTDFVKKLKITQRTDTDYFVAYKNTTTKPLWEDILPLDYDFIQGKSPWESKANVWDNDKWYPQLQFQEQILNSIASCGPGTPKFTGDNMGSVKCEYQFHFKFGGNPPPMQDIDDPKTQPMYPMPSNILQTTSLQNPASPLEYYLQSFDWRRHMLTDTAIERIKKDFQTETYSISDGEHPMDSKATKTYQTTQEQTSTTEENEKALFQQLQQQRQEQQLLRYRIAQTLQQIQNIE